MNSFGHNFKITIFGESHNKQIGIVIDGVPNGIELEENDFIKNLNRRNPNFIGTTTRKELDKVEILSGVFNKKTTGTAITLTVNNTDINSKSYNPKKYRPSHADFVAAMKYNNCNDFRGGGIFSGRMTIAFVLAGVVAMKVLENTDITSKIDIASKIISIGGIKCNNEYDKLNSDVIDLITKTKNDGDTLGGIIECKINNIPIGLGEPFFNSIESVLSHIIFSIPGIVGIEFGDGFSIADKKGSEVNDIYIDNTGKTATNHFGGINGGISNGNEIIFRVAVRPPASIQIPQTTYNFEKNIMDEQKIEGRHDVCFAIRVPVILESVSAIALADLL